MQEPPLWQQGAIGITRTSRFVIHPPWLEPNKDRGESPIVIDPGPAFGHGGHPTTVMVLELLCDEGIHGQVVGDVGCGTGVLAIVAAKLGASRVWATDTDSDAVETTRRNAESNSVLVDIVNGVDAADIALINVTIDVHEMLAGSVTAPTVVASGILVHQVDRIERAYGAQLESTRQRDGWVAGVFRRT